MSLFSHQRDDGLWVIAVQPSQEWAAAHAQRVRRVEKADGLVMAATVR